MNPNSSIGTIDIPEGVDPDVFLAAVMEAIAKVKAEVPEHVVDDTPPEVGEDPQHSYEIGEVVEGVVNHATFQITPVEGGRYGEVVVESFSATDTDSVDTDTETDTTRVRARRTNPSTVARHVVSTMIACVEYENQSGRQPNVTCPHLIGWVIADPYRKAESHNGDAHYRGYNGRDLIADVESHVSVEYTKAQIRVALNSLIAAGSVVENGRVSKAKRYVLSKELNDQAINAGKGA